MKKIFAILLVLCITFSPAVSMALSEDAFMPENPIATIGTNSTNEQSSVGSEWYWKKLFDGEISTEENKVTTGFADYSVSPEKGETAWVTIDMGGEYEISGVRVFARLGWPSQSLTKGYLYISSDGETYVRSDMQEFSNDDRFIDVVPVFGGVNYNVTARYVKIEAVQVGGDDSNLHFNMEEIEFLTAKAELENRNVESLPAHRVINKMEITPTAVIGTNSTNEQSATGNEWYWKKLFDGEISTEENKVTTGFANYSISPEKGETAWVTIDMGGEYEISGVRVYNRLGWPSQSLTKGYLYISNDGETFVRSDMQEFGRDDRFIDVVPVFGGVNYNVTARYIKIEAVQVGGDDSKQHFNMEEIEFMKATENAESRSVADLYKYKPGNVAVEEPKAVLDSNTTNPEKNICGDRVAGMLFDGIISKEPNTIQETYANYTINPSKNETAWVTVDLGREYEFSGVRVFARLGWPNQAITKGYIYVSDDGETFMRSDLQTFDREARFAELKATFGKADYNITARYIKVEAIQVGGDDSNLHFNMEEIEFIEPKRDLEKRTAADLADYRAPGRIKDRPLAVIETNSTSEQASVANEWYWKKLFDGEISYIDENIIETYAIYSIYPDKNESAWVKIDMKKESEISGIRIFSRLSRKDQSLTKGYLYFSDDGEKYIRTDLQEFDKNARFIEPKAIFGGENFNVTARYIMIEAVQVGGDDSKPHWSMEEIEFIKPDETAESKNVTELSDYISEEIKAPDGGKSEAVLSDKSAWIVSASSEFSEWTGARAAFDDDRDTFWHSKYTAENGQVTWKEPTPYEINVTFPEEIYISGMTYQPRSALGGTITKCEIYGSDSDSGEMTLLTIAEMTPDTGFKTVNFYANVRVKRIRLNITETLSGVGTAAEFDFLEKRSELKNIALWAYSDYEERKKPYLIDSSNFSVTSETPAWAGHDVSSMFDGGVNSFWQTEATEFPVSFDIDMKKAQEIVKIECLPRQSSDCHGNWKAFEIWAGDDKASLAKVYETADSPRTLDKKVIEFDAPLNVRYIRFVINDAYANRASCAEVYLYQSKEAMDRAQAEGYEKYVLDVDNNKVTVTKGLDTYEKELDTELYMYPAKGTAMIPLFGLIEEMGGEIEWIGDTQEINIGAASGRVEMQVQRKTIVAEHPNYGMIRYTLDVAPKIKDSKVYIPLRFVSEHLGYDVSWNGETREITIEKK